MQELFHVVVKGKELGYRDTKEHHVLYDTLNNKMLDITSIVEDTIRVPNLAHETPLEMGGFYLH